MAHRATGPSTGAALHRPRAIGRLLLAALLLAALGPTAFAAGRDNADNPPPVARRMLVLESYHPGFTWTDNSLWGIYRSIGMSGLPIDVSVEYMDLKRLLATPEHLQLLESLIRFRQGQAPFEVVVACDNDALEFLLDRPDLIPRAPIVFTGINNFSPAMLRGRADVTGVVENPDYIGTIELALRLRPGAKTVVAITDNTTTGRAQREALDRQKGGLPRGVSLRWVSFGDTTLDELGSQLAELGDTDIPLLLDCSVDKRGKAYTVEYATRYLTGRCPVPIFVVTDSRLRFGVLGGLVTSGTSQGEAAAEMAIAILRGRDVRTIPVLAKSPNSYLFDDGALRRFGIADRSLPEGSTIQNRPPTMLQTYRREVVSAGMVFALLLVSLAVLGFEVLRRRRIEASLEKSEAALATVLDAVPSSIFWKDVNSVYLGCNEFLAKQRNLPDPRAIAGKTDADLGFTLDEAEARRADDAEVIATGRALTRFGQQVKRSDGTVGWLDVKKVPLRDAAGRVYGVLGVVDEVTERHKAESEKAKLLDQLQQSMKMEAVGRLAGGVAHDFNNLLTAISGNVELAKGDLDPAHPTQELLSEVEKAANSAVSLTRQLLAFSRKQMIEPRVVNLNELVKQLQSMLTRLIGEDVSLETVLEPDLGSVKVDPGQFEQVIVNMAVNARDAMPQGGRLLIQTENVDLDETYCASHPNVQPGGYVRVTITDTGVGMSPDVQNRLFEPFFTTKPKGRGTGLGLATAFGSVRQAGGDIEVYSEVAVGTTFKIYLPRVAEAARQLPLDAATAEALPLGHERILLVEDDGAVRALALAMLCRLGYTVLDAPDGPAALTLGEQHSERIDLLMTDVVMPGMNGRELADRIVSRHPEMRVLFTSGYTEDIILHHGLVDGDLNFIGKPYSLHVLAKKVRAVLDAPESPHAPLGA